MRGEGVVIVIEDYLFQKPGFDGKEKKVWFDILEDDERRI